MAYLVHFERDEDYLNNLPLSAEGKRKVEQFIGYAIADVKDDFRTDRANRPLEGGPYFVREFILHDTEGDGHFHTVRIVVNDAGASAGVLVIVFVDHYRGGKWAGPEARE